GDYGIRKIIPSKDQHPTQKPVELAAHFIRLHTRPGDTVLDPFMGSGTTGVAAVKLGRNFIGIEIDKGYFEIAQKRIAEAQRQPALFIDEG
ncbi:MAG: site-specific DNA-methyltransferase, partial [Clostridiales bacterium]|nr:site-specific DNA-methyltransferase [Clostridiales bacterium]